MLNLFNKSKKHFKLRKDLSIQYLGRTLYRIETLIDLPNGLKKGDLGGYVENEDNLDGNAWVYDNAKVFDNAKVHGNVLVYNNAQVYGNAWVFDNAKVCGYAKVHGNALVFDNAKIYGNAQVFGNAAVCGDVILRKNVEISSSNQIVTLKIHNSYSVTITPTYVFISCKSYKINEIKKMTKKKAIEEGLPEEMYAVHKDLILTSIKYIG